MEAIPGNGPAFALLTDRDVPRAVSVPVKNGAILAGESRSQPREQCAPSMLG